MAEESYKAIYEVELDYSQARSQTEKFWKEYEQHAAKANVSAGKAGKGGGNVASEEEKAAKKAAQEAEKAAAATAKITERLSQSKTAFESLGREAALFNNTTREGAQALAQIYAAQAKELGVQRNINQNEKERAELLRQQIELQNKASSSRKLAGARESGYQSVYKQDDFKYTRAAAADSKAASGLNSGLGSAIGKLGPFAAAAGAATVKLNQLSEKFVEYSKNISDKGGKLDQQAQKDREKEKTNTYLSLTDPSTWFAGLKSDIEKNINELLISFGGKEQAAKVQKTYDNVTFKGEDKKRLDQLLRDRSEMEADLTREQMDMERGLFEQRRDLALEGQKLDEDFYRKRRDLVLEGSKLNEEYSRKRRDLDIDDQKAALDNSRKQADFSLKRGRLDEDNALKLQKFAENFSGQMAKARFDLDRTTARRDFAKDRTRAGQDLARDMARSSQDFGDKLFDMQAGGATALEYFQAYREYNKNQARKQEDFQTTDARAKEDFANSEKDAAAKRQLEVMQEEYERKYELIDLTKDYNRSIQDLGIEISRQAQDFQMIQQELANKRADLATDENFARTEYANKQRDLSVDERMARQEYANKLSDYDYSSSKARRDYDINAFRQRRSSEEGLADFAGDIRGKYDDAMATALLKNAGLQKYSDMESKRRGETPLDFTDSAKNQYNQAKDNVAKRTGDIQLLSLLGPLGTLPGMLLGNNGPKLGGLLDGLGLGGMLSGGGASGGSFAPISPIKNAAPIPGGNWGAGGGSVSITAPNVTINGTGNETLRKQFDNLNARYIQDAKKFVTFSDLNGIVDTRSPNG